MIEIVPTRGALGDERLGWIVDLYGPVDPKYASLEFVRHQFDENPFGWSAHAFVMDGERAAGHCAAVPFQARRDGQPLVAGKIEAVVVAPDYRGRRTESGGSLAVEMLKTMYAFAHEQGIELLFGLAPPRVAAIHARAGCRRVTVDAPTQVLVTDPRTVARDWSPRRRAATVGLSIAQNALVSTLSLLAGGGRLDVRRPDESDRELAVAAPRAGHWVVSGDDAWDWYVGSGVLRTVALGADGPRALVRFREGDRTAIQVVAWTPAGRGLRHAFRLLGGLRRLARASGAPTLRFQPWRGSGGDQDGLLQRACKLLGFVQRGDVELVLHDRVGSDGGPLEPTPFLYVTF